MTDQDIATAIRFRLNARGETPLENQIDGLGLPGMGPIVAARQRARAAAMRANGRGRGRNRNRAGRGNAPRRPIVQTFFGNTDGMQGNVFQCNGESTSKQQFLKTVGVLEEHINKTFDYPQDIASVCKSFETTALVVPANLPKTVYDTDMAKRMIWETTMKTYMKRTDKMESNLRAIYAIVWGQCSPMMQSKLESLDDYDDKSTDCDCVWLLKEIQGITHKFEGTRNVFISLDDAWCHYYAYHQGPNQSLHEYLKEYQSLVQVLEHYGAAIGADGPYLASVKEKLKATLPSTLSADELQKRTLAAAKLQAIAMGFLKRADRRRYGGLWSELENNFTRGQDQYPADLTNAYNMLLNYQPAPGTLPPRRDRHG
jgi:hypothetical protein